MMVGKCDDNEDYSIVSTIIVKVSNLNGMPDNNIVALVMIILSIIILYIIFECCWSILVVYGYS
jgi:hypothetical protein